jgi:hypothetical protein
MLVHIGMLIPVNFAARMFVLVRLTVPATVSMHMVVLRRSIFAFDLHFAGAATAGNTHFYSF